MFHVLVQSFSVLHPSAVFVDSFNAASSPSFEQRWSTISTDPYSGEWAVEGGLQNSGIEGDLGLLLKSPARRHAIVAPFDQPFDVTDKDFVVQYEVRFNTALQCGGAYIKLLTQTEAFSASSFGDATPYTIMFGPDKYERCLTTRVSLWFN